jgi:3',5'-cyclic AMP phosphodiesterase CpdA
LNRAGCALVLATLGLALEGCGAPAVLPVVAPSPPPAGFRYLAGGDSRNDTAHVVPWAFAEARARHASGFFFLGDMELTPELDGWFKDELAQLSPVAFFPVLGNHEIQEFGFLPIGVARAERSFRVRFLDSVRGAPASALPDKVVYGIDLPGGVHFVALDNVTGRGFGPAQLAWLADDLARARERPANHFIVVGMHKPLAGNGVSPHGMEHDGPAAVADSNAALALFRDHHVSLILMSHVHQFAKLEMAGIPAYITGGLGAPLDNVGPTRAFHHFLQIDTSDAGLEVSVVPFPGVQGIAHDNETEED